MLLIAPQSAMEHVLEARATQLGVRFSWGVEVVGLSQDADGVTVALGDGAALPSRKVIARKGDRQENIIYWTRLGEYLPASARDQKVDRLRAAMSGVIPDGALFRFSEVGDDAQRSFDGIDVFIRDLVMAVAPGQRQALLGTRLAGVLGTTKA